jgi:hypothetical protein
MLSVPFSLPDNGCFHKGAGDNRPARLFPAASQFVQRRT